MPEKPEILPPEPNGIATVAPSAMSFNAAWQRATPLQKGMFFLLSAGTVASASMFALGQFFQTRGVQSMLTSRVFLVVACLFPIFWVWQVALLLQSKRGIWIAVATTIILLAAAYALDHAFPMAKITATESQAQSTNNPKSPTAADIAKVIPKAEHPTGSVVRPVKAPLEIVAFRSDYGISIANNGPLPVYVISLLIKTRFPDGSKSIGLGSSYIEAGKVFEHKLHDEGLQHCRTLRKLADTWEDHVKKASDLYGKCGMQLSFLSPSDPSCQNIKDQHSGHNQALGYDDIPGILYYRVQGVKKTEEQVVPIVETIVVNDDACPRL
jgi:hypothetical protein